MFQYELYVLPWEHKVDKQKKKKKKRNRGKNVLFAVKNKKLRTYGKIK